MRRRQKERLKRRLALALALALLAALAFFLPYLWSSSSGDDIPPDGLGRPLASNAPVAKHSGNRHLAGAGLGDAVDACIMG
jgi:hypothetical protein